MTFKPFKTFETMKPDESAEPIAGLAFDFGYRAPWWLPGGHLQTIYARTLAKNYRVAFRRERWETPDQDFIDLDWLGQEADRRQTRRAVSRLGRLLAKPLRARANGKRSRSGLARRGAALSRLQRRGQSACALVPFGRFARNRLDPAAPQKRKSATAKFMSSVSRSAAICF